MEPLIELSSVVAPLLRDNIDTDTIIPAAYMRSLATDPATGLFAHWRYRSDGREEPGFVLNDPRYRGARVLLTGANFGCGSSRENAVWALQRFGFRCVIALGFSDIFHENCFKNGVLPIVVGREDHARLAERAEGLDPFYVTVDVGARMVLGMNGEILEFELDARRQAMLMSGADEIASTLALGARIEAFRAGHRARKPWLYGGGR
jgi:3-isopropylmalate/(R)-2-methylmalate dehydratase small subunit